MALETGLKKHADDVEISKEVSSSNVPRNYKEIGIEDITELGLTQNISVYSASIAQILNPEERIADGFQEPIQFLTAKLYELRDKSARGITSSSLDSEGISLNGTSGYRIESNFTISSPTIFQSSGHHASGHVIAKTPICVLSTNDDTTDAYNSTPWEITWNLEQIKDGDFFGHSTTTDPEDIEVLYDGRYEISWTLVYNAPDNARQRAVPVQRIYINGLYDATSRYTSNTTYIRRNGHNNGTCVGGHILALDAGDKISIASMFLTNFSTDATDGDSMALKNYNAALGFSKLIIKMIG